MTEHPRRVKIEAEVDEETADALARAIAEGEVRDAGALIAGALARIEDERWGREDPASWGAHGAEVRAAVAEADADPDGDMDADVFFAELRGELEERAAARAVQAAE